MGTDRVGGGPWSISIYSEAACLRPCEETRKHEKCALPWKGFQPAERRGLPPATAREPGDLVSLSPILSDVRGFLGRIELV